MGNEVEWLKGTIITLTTMTLKTETEHFTCNKVDYYCCSGCITQVSKVLPLPRDLTFLSDIQKFDAQRDL